MFENDAASRGVPLQSEPRDQGSCCHLLTADCHRSGKSFSGNHMFSTGCFALPASAQFGRNRAGAEVVVECF